MDNWAENKALGRGKGLENNDESLKASSLGYLLSRYFGHGLSFSLFELALGLFLVPLFLILIVATFFVGFVIGLLVLFLVFGAVNGYLMEKIWNIPVEDRWEVLMVHGLVLCIALTVLNIPFVIISSNSKNFPIALILFAVYCLVDGYICKFVGAHWETERPLNKTDKDSERFLEVGKI